MSCDLELECRCGAIHGTARGVSPDSVNRVICFCADCQTFVHHLGRADLLDAKGGSDIIQVAPATVAFDRGTENIAALRLGPKGPYRWYATCCKTPLGNTVEPSLPFVGIVFELFRDARSAEKRDEVFGPPRASIHGKSAIGEPPPGSTGMSFRFLARTIRIILGWKLGGRVWPHPYFDRESGKPLYPVAVLSKEEREAASAKRGAQ